jgi:eukaryotic-like serine/threonine-protein kinase
MHYRHGQTIPGTQYRFIRELGAGGHGTVYAVEHTFLEAPAVMKLLHVELIDRADLTHRMTREAKTLAKLRHPNIVEVKDGGISGEAQPRPYFVMESLNGMPLRDLLRHVKAPGGVGVLPALRIMTGVLDGLEHAHRAGVIHRDIKPDNIFLHRTSTDHTVPKILDFGIAHLLMAQRTTGNYFLGTPRYAAPEQLRGDAPTARTDIYAAGLMLYEMLTGEAPFAEHKEIGDILKAHLEQPLPSVMNACPDAPLYLANFVSMLTAKDPNDRAPTAFAAAVGLREIRSRLENQQAGVLNNTGFKTEPTPMENMLLACRVEP